MRVEFSKNISRSWSTQNLKAWQQFEHEVPTYIGLWIFGAVLKGEEKDMFKNKKSIFVLVAGIFSIFGLIPGGLAGDRTAFHCSLGLDGRAMARGELVLSEDGSALQYKLAVHNVEDITMAHLHLGKAGKIGTPVVWLYPDAPPPKLIPGLFKGVLAEGTITQKNLIGPMRGKRLPALIAEIRAGNVYVNIHTRTHARGDICGPVYLAEE